MKVMRKMEVEVEKAKNFKIGDQIQVGECFTATCQKISKKGAIFLFDQYLDESYAMNDDEDKEGNYETSDLRTFLIRFSLDPMFDEIRYKMVHFKNGDLLRIPTAEEMFGPEESSKFFETNPRKKQWILMKDDRNRITCEADKWGWLQNKCFCGKDGEFAIVGSCCTLECGCANFELGVRVVFRLSM